MGMLFYDAEFDAAMVFAEGHARLYCSELSAALRAADFAFDDAIVSRHEEMLQLYWPKFAPPAVLRDPAAVAGYDFRIELMRQHESGSKDWLVDLQYRLDRMGPRTTLAGAPIARYRMPAGIATDCLGECLANMLTSLSTRAVCDGLRHALKRALP